MGSEQGFCDPHLIKTNWFDKWHRLDVYKEICALISVTQVTVKIATVPFTENINVISRKKMQKIWIIEIDANSMPYFSVNVLRQSDLKSKQSLTGQMQLLLTKEQQNLSVGSISKHTELISLLKMKHSSGRSRWLCNKHTFLLRGSCVPYSVTLSCTVINSCSMFRQTKSLAFFHYPCVPRNSTSVSLYLRACFCAHVSTYVHLCSIQWHK